MADLFSNWQIWIVVGITIIAVLVAWGWFADLINRRRYVDWDREPSDAECAFMEKFTDELCCFV